MVPEPPLPVPQAVPVLVMKPELSTCRQKWPLDAAMPGNWIAPVPVNEA